MSKSLVEIILLMIVAFFGGGMVFSSDFRSKVWKMVRGKQKEPRSLGQPSWLDQIKSEPQKPEKSPDNGQMDVDKARALLKRQGYYVRKNRK